MEEIWKDIEGYEGLYQVSNLGRVKRIMFINNKTIKPSNKVLSCNKKDKSGYVCVTLWKDGTRKYDRMHRIVAKTFIPNIDNKPVINHKDGNKANNCVENLEWVTYKENTHHALKTGLFKNTHRSKKVIQYDKNMKPIKQYSSTKEVERRLGYDASSIRDCCTGRKHHKTAYGYIWKYKED